MDAVELARRSAAALHATAVAAGHDPCQPYAFAVAIANLRGLDVEPTKPGAAILDGGRATLIPKDDLIVHEKRGTDFERAFLVAHEIGHAELGDRRDPTDGTVVDPARSSEPAPIGPDRVDYSRRQRREVQMDLFARELLLPRAGAARAPRRTGSVRQSDRGALWRAVRGRRTAALGRSAFALD